MSGFQVHSTNLRTKWRGRQTIAVMSTDQEQSSYPYKGIHAIIVSWSDDDMDIYDELIDLKNAFGSLNFSYYQMYSIPSQNSFDSLLKELQEHK